jgi:hypothetical protein
VWDQGLALHAVHSLEPLPGRDATKGASDAAAHPRFSALINIVQACQTVACAPGFLQETTYALTSKRDFLNEI